MREHRSVSGLFHLAQYLQGSSISQCVSMLILFMAGEYSTLYPSHLLLLH